VQEQRRRIRRTARYNVDGGVQFEPFAPFTTALDFDAGDLLSRRVGQQAARKRIIYQRHVRVFERRAHAANVGFAFRKDFAGKAIAGFAAYAAPTLAQINAHRH